MTRLESSERNWKRKSKTWKSEKTDSEFRNEVKGALVASAHFSRVVAAVGGVLWVIVIGWVASINISMSGHNDRLTHMEDRAADLKDIKADIAENAKDTSKIQAITEQVSSHLDREESAIIKTDSSLEALGKNFDTLSGQLTALGRSVDSLKPIVQQLQIEDDSKHIGTKSAK